MDQLNWTTVFVIAAYVVAAIGYHDLRRKFFFLKDENAELWEGLHDLDLDQARIVNHLHDLPDIGPKLLELQQRDLAKERGEAWAETRIFSQVQRGDNDRI